MKNRSEEIVKILNNLSKNIFIKETKKGYLLEDRESKMTFSLDLDEYDSIIRQNKKHIINKIFKKGPSRVLDCTGGFGRDSAIISSLGNSVTMIEENPLIMKVLRDAICRIKNNNIGLIFEKITTKLGNCLDYIKTTNKLFDYIYFDFMFNTNKSALPSKREQFLRMIANNDIDVNRDIIKEVIQRVGCKVIIKEHIKSNDYKHLDIINTYKERVVKYHLLQGKNEYY
jgi:protein-L-isoaspartate O-methyltransferase